jgi:hypothetical protein
MPEAKKLAVEKGLQVVQMTADKEPRSKKPSTEKRRGHKKMVEKPGEEIPEVTEEPAAVEHPEPTKPAEIVVEKPVADATVTKEPAAVEHPEPNRTGVALHDMPTDKNAGMSKDREPVSKSIGGKRKQPDHETRIQEGAILTTDTDSRRGADALKEGKEKLKGKGKAEAVADAFGENAKKLKPELSSSAPGPRRPPNVSEDYRKLRDKLDRNATAVIDSLNALRNATSELSTTAEALSQLGSSKQTIALARDTLLTRKLRGVVGYFCRPQDEAVASDKKPGIFETEEYGAKGLEGLVMEPIMNLVSVLDSWAVVEGKPIVSEGRAIHRWRAKAPLIDRPISVIEVKEQTISGQPQEQPQEQPQAEKGPSFEAFRSTGNISRDDAIRVLAHALVTAFTPVEAALEIELVLYTRYCSPSKSPDKDKEGKEGGNQLGTDVTVDYLKKVKALWSALSPASPQCRPLLRYMLLNGMLTPGELVVITPELLAAKEREAKEQLLVCKPGWLSDVLAAVQMSQIPK